MKRIVSARDVTQSVASGSVVGVVAMIVELSTGKPGVALILAVAAGILTWFSIGKGKGQR